MLSKLRQNLLVIFIVSALLLLVFLLSLHNFIGIGQDIGLHLSLGKIAWQEHRIVTTNFFSFTTPDFIWLNNTWLSKAVFYLVWAWVGMEGLIVFNALMLTVALSLAFFAFYKKETLLPVSIVTVLSIFIFVERSAVRPEIFSYLFLGWYLFVLFKEDERLIWSLPLIQILWVNSHIYFILGPLLYGLFLVHYFIRQKSMDKRGRRFLLVGLLMCVANLINPLGLKEALYPFFVFKNYAVPVLENQSPVKLFMLGYSRFSSSALFAGIVLTLIGFFANYKKLRDNIFSLGLFIATSALSLIMLRNVAVFALAMIPINAKNLHGLGINFRRRNLLVTMAVLLLLLLISVVDNEFNQAFYPDRKFGTYVPEGPQRAVDFIKDHRLRGPMFNNYNIGGFLIWQLPGEKVFIDSRPEAYPADFIRDVYIGMQKDYRTWKIYSEQYHINMAVLDYFDSNDYFINFLQNISEDDDWALVYKDGWAVIFLKRTADNADIIKQYEIGIK
ncbi:MAG: hypothetical protein A3B99_03630 [Candidatus Yanofskybacteria bacterium RIFCSPHIGHO2_02_FULL_44_12b]|uniref:Glycosyltransferase RgtA/B/C/D-like domain-containing protein n=2 Tax=Candidatus Yanofskyibacteriota TaxID=1752733 RepID=A0A1F8GMM1_9BACT|nr:MAG: hypothetical protein UW79_C0010G0027 [Candidatus Yanofskybacteria bacterium GW2011_GWA2_44_9]OGN04726.1 MAG: hypothetical protein A2659_01210 [Candidatus Yanofskybacteria bacterium RIFCSPHIGHO2_01_FULL_44_24]OGN15610.1 MAG: hypothetical protein A3B99_03630 [Candidatus Yanofskybacteria bacterium RIFCSPHIGHO2_02_FULL_44_12b]OGN26665.1 MAG: hypothetical protein A2925_03715 [Candidatus Yanofskybacteria bacterium RIFCSPLOWO2_01_FULL_44_22]